MWQWPVARITVMRCLWLGLIFLSAQAGAETFPSRTITLVGQNAAGGANDLTLRLIAEHFRQLTGKNMIVDAKPGVNGAVALAYLKAQKADGYHLTMAGRSAIVQYWINNAKVGYHPLEDFTYIATVGGASRAVVVRADSPYKTIQDLTKAARERPGALSVSTVGHGSPHHQALEAWAAKTGIKVQHVPYRGDLPSLTAVWAGEVTLAISGGTYVDWVKDGRMRVLAVTGDERHPRYPDAPSFAQLGYETTGSLPFAFAGPQGMDPAAAAYLESVFKKIAEDKVFQEKLFALGNIPAYKSGKDTLKFVQERFPIEKAIVDKYGLANR